MNRQGQPRPHNHPKRILVIEHEELLAWCLALELRSCGFEVEVALDLKSGLRSLRDFSPDLVLCDQEFPDGRCLHMLGAWNASHKKIPSIVMTAYTPPSALEMQACFTLSYLRKPFEMTELMSAIELAGNQRK